tara:strand:- start:10986 stop:11708 length:723 start_codon:yes stop_codon:yes gene_type:complete
MRLIVTRPLEDQAALTTALEALGHEVIAAPLLEIRFLENVVLPDLAWQALLVTSANGVRALLAQENRQARALPRDLPVLAVGSASAEAAREAGFENVGEAGGDVVSLTALVRERLDHAAGPLLHVAGSVVAGDLKGALEADGFSVERAVLYEAIVPDDLPEAAQEALSTGEAHGVLFYSPRTAETFVRLVRGAGYEAALGAVRAFCLSEAVAEKLAGLPFAAIHVARLPTQEDMLALIAG